MIGPRTPGVRNVLLGWLGVALPSPVKHRRRPHRKTARTRTPRLIERLEAAGCQPRQVGDDTWFALCPSCKAEGRLAAVEIRRTESGALLLACVEAHEGERAA